MGDAPESMSFQLTELVDELARDSDSGGEGDEVNGMHSMPAAEGEGPAFDRSKGERAASAFWRCCQDNGLAAFCDALTFSGLRDELPRLAEPGITVLVPTNEAFAAISEASRSDQRLVRQLLLGHVCPGVSTFADIKAKHCAVAVAGQTHAVYEEEGHAFVGTSKLGRTDLTFDGGVIHIVTSCLTVLSLVRDSHSEQVWKKSLQPSPILSALGGVSALGVEFEVHGCLLHAATGQLVPEALRGHVRNIKPINEEQRLTFGEITVMTKPPSLAKRRGAAGAPDGSNRYRLLFSIWNTTSLSYISWQVCVCVCVCPPARWGPASTHSPLLSHLTNASALRSGSAWLSVCAPFLLLLLLFLHLRPVLLTTLAHRPPPLAAHGDPARGA